MAEKQQGIQCYISHPEMAGNFPKLPTISRNCKIFPRMIHSNNILFKPDFLPEAKIIRLVHINCVTPVLQVLSATVAIATVADRTC